MTTEIHDAPRLLQGITGSRAYGLATPESDTDRMAVCVLPTSRFLGINLPHSSKLTHHADHTSGDSEDITIHEVGKFVSLCLKANPTVTELLWLDRYEATSSFGYELVDNRDRLLSAHSVRTAYLGYATAQVNGALRDKAQSRREKYARHAWRLCRQAMHLWRTGEVQVMLTPWQVDKARYFGRTADHDSYRNLLSEVEKVFDTTGTPLPVSADEDWANDFVRRVRLAHLED